MDFHLPKFGSAVSPIPFGLDISDFYLRLMQLKRNGKNLTVKTYHQIEVPAGLINGGEIIKDDEVVHLIKKLISETPGEKVDTKEVITALPEPKTFIKQVTFNWPEDNDPVLTEGDKKNNSSVTPASKNKSKKDKDELIHKIIMKDVAEDIPLPLNEASLDYEIIEGEIKNIHPGQQLRTLVGIAPKKITERYIEILEKSGLTPIALEIEGVAIARALIKNNPKELPTLTKIVVDLGATRTGLIVYHNNIVRYSLSIPISGQQITQTIAESLKITTTEAEKIKSTYNFNGQENPEIGHLITPLLENIVDKIKESIIFCQSKFPNLTKEKTEIILCGGGANWLGLTAMLNQKLGLKISIGNPWVNFDKIPPDFPLAKSLSYTTAIGLSLRGLYDI